MDAFVKEVLAKIDGDPARLGEVFPDRLSTRDELLLTKLDEELAMVVEHSLDLALHGAGHNGEVHLDQRSRDRIMELTAIRRAIGHLIRTRGSLNAWRDGLN